MTHFKNTVEYYEKQIDELESEVKLFEEICRHQRKRADTWRKRFEVLLETITEVRLS